MANSIADDGVSLSINLLIKGYNHTPIKKLDILIMPILINWWENQLGSSSFIFSDDFTPIREFDTHNHFWQLIFPIKAAPGFFSRLDKLEDHDERCFSSNWLQVSKE